MLQIVSKYVDYVQNIKEYIDNSPYKTSFIYESLEMSKQNFYRKMRTLNFTPNEVLKISKILFPKEAYKQELLESIERGREDFKKGNTMTSDEVRLEMRKKIKSYQ